MAYSIKEIETELDFALAVRLYNSEQAPKVYQEDDDQCWLWQIFRKAPADAKGVSFGILAFNDDHVVGALFFVFQGIYRHDLREVPIVNLSTFYVNADHRGILPIMMMKRSMKLLKGCIITNYTPNPQVIAISKSLGFLSQSVERRLCVPQSICGIFDIFKLKQVRSYSAKNFPELKTVGSCFFDTRLWGSLTTFKFLLKDGSSIYLQGVERSHKRKIGSLSFTFRSFTIYVITGNDEKKRNRAIQALTWFRIIRLLSPLVLCYSALRSRGPAFKASWLIHVPDGLSVDCVLPISSEIGLSSK